MRRTGVYSQSKNTAVGATWYFYRYTVDRMSSTYTPNMILSVHAIARVRRHHDVHASKIYASYVAKLRPFV